MGRVKLMRCCNPFCDSERLVQVHHVRRYGSRKDHFRTCPLCRSCHETLHQHHKRLIDFEDVAVKWTLMELYGDRWTEYIRWEFP
jgi:hypothetical protein